ncbi:zinc-binding dehydrogenase [Streptomyces sp. NPDC046805]|uniref:zinc-binding dehydrogenase n=1 Tax=Streptomyces sp. NPDC046805 TaxID=3155134 RepID=UPI0033C8C1F6
MRRAQAGLEAAGASLVGRSALGIGCGPIGLLVVAVLRRAGVRSITAVDLVPRALELARVVGATQTIQAGTGQAQATIADVQADVTFESSGSHIGLASAIAGTARGAALVMSGLLPPGPQPVPISAAIAKELDLLCSFRFNDENGGGLRAAEGAGPCPECGGSVATADPYPANCAQRGAVPSPGVFVRIEDREDDFEGLVHTSKQLRELRADPRDAATS